MKIDVLIWDSALLKIKQLLIKTALYRKLFTITSRLLLCYNTYNYPDVDNKILFNIFV